MNTRHSTLNESQSLDWDESISALIDGEDINFDLENLDNSYGRQVWDTYHLIGDVMRSDELAIKPSDLFYARVSKAIDAEPAPVVPARRFGLRQGLSGLAVAAAVASVVWVVQPFMAEDEVAPAVSAPVVASQTSSGTELNRDYSDYIHAHRQMVGARPVHLVSYEYGVNR
ncbi:MAG: sigma-E factor negative regulatory protein [Advenella sp.]|jgi:sigma-E factor negative regulatory protein RseA|uniref:sigma-E factor negative regulatory protein n=1 Tax=Advenella sp. TaxID=1872388 RepID=UPI0016B0246E|nr:sigma-E factor negative regulatory protein [Advenella sp.]MDD3757248.1 sigma-E factor negative regulatory protein [Advenella sp.]NLN67679.1 sigma-E factor negative regulatory protein [Alcaligenaceae bacterium]